jgi:predicted aspartyl protease
MGMFRIDVTVSNPKDLGRSFMEKFWVDTAALYTFVPEDHLEAIGVEPIHSRDLILADGRRERRLLGEALLLIQGIDGRITCPVIFAPKGSLYLLGVTALENLGVEVDRIGKTLKPIFAIIGGCTSSTLGGE